MTIPYPYLPAGRSIEYVRLENPWMAAARDFAKENNTIRHVGAAVIVKDGAIIGRGSIGAGPHTNGCEREKHNVPTGTGYELCAGCGYENHSEASAIRNAKESGADTKGADLYLWGHWWCCEPCWSTMIDAGIKSVYLLEGSEKLFNKSDPDNVIGHQFE
ncbi:MAG: hypothetical protein HYS26_02370 [Candidatus Kaiserbacteria bacterium]|nr:MAG: hypothetical protein HYS26_02370 [Candidatus Kaiserbacteria bacterium]